jgi:hypothetical protein
MPAPKAADFHGVGLGMLDLAFETKANAVVG